MRLSPHGLIPCYRPCLLILLHWGWSSNMNLREHNIQIIALCLHLLALTFFSSGIDHCFITFICLIFKHCFILQFSNNTNHRNSLILVNYHIMHVCAEKHPPSPPHPRVLPPAQLWIQSLRSRNFQLFHGNIFTIILKLPCLFWVGSSISFRTPFWVFSFLVYTFVLLEHVFQYFLTYFQRYIFEILFV